MVNRKVLEGKPYVGETHVRFDEVEVALSAARRLGSMLCRKCIPLALVFVAGFSASATTWYFNGGNDSINSGVTDPGKWIDDNKNAATAFSVDDYYIVHNNNRLRISDKAFAGGVLQLGNQSASGDSRIGGIVHDNATKTTSFPNGAHFDYGYYWLNVTTSDSQRDGTLAGNVVVRSSDEHPFVFYAPRNNRAIYITAVLSSQTPPSKINGTAVDTRFVVGPHTLGAKSYSCGENFALFIIGDASSYKGTISVTSAYEVVGGGWTTRLCVGDTMVGGKVNVEKGAAIAALKGVMNTYTYYPSVGTVSKLKFSDGAVFQLHYDEDEDKYGMLNVADEFTAEGTVYVNVNKIPASSNGREMPILTASEGAIDASKFVRVFNDSNEASDDKTKLPRRTHFVVKTASGRDTLYLMIEPIATLEKHDVAERTNTGDSSALLTAANWSNADAWSDGTMPSEYSYWAATTIRTTGTNEDYAFPGRSFTLADNTFYLGGNRRLSFDLFYWVDGALRVINGHKPVICGGRIVTYSGKTLNMRCYNGSILTIESEIEGGATLQLLDEGSTGASYGNLALAGLNTNFTGKIWLDRTAYVPGNFARQYMNLHVADARNLGGKLPEFAYDALKLRHHGQLWLLDDVVLDASSNRGLFVDVAGGILSLEFDLTLGWPLTMNGLLRKNGTGTLTMASSVRFLDADGALSDCPRANSNLFNVTAGKVRVAKHDAMDGLAATFSNGTALELPLNPEDESLTKYGILNAKTETPFALGANLGALPLTLDITGCPELKTLPQTFGVVTVTNLPATVSSVRSILPPVRPYENVHHRLIERINEGEGTVTFAVVVEHVGFRVILK